MAGDISRENGRKGGRPKKLTEALLKKATKYLEYAKDEERQLIKQQNDEKGYVMYENRMEIRLPTIAGLARYLHVSRETVYDWAEKNVGFSDIVCDIMVEQEERLINGALGGQYNAGFAKLLMTKHGYADRNELTGKDGGPIEVEGNEITITGYGKKR